MRLAALRSQGFLAVTLAVTGALFVAARGMTGRAAGAFLV